MESNVRIIVKDDVQATPNNVTLVSFEIPSGPFLRVPKKPTQNFS
jgi:hypothetical protein